MMFIPSITTYISILLVIISIKVLLIPSYHSTDFEVHRNWLAITHSLPLKDWYFEETSEWTLDYPPFFAYFENFLAKFASRFDPNIVKVDNLYYKSKSMIYFHRGSVIFSDLLFYFAIIKYLSHSTNIINDKIIFIFLLIIYNIGLLLVDHIHFQYNGILLGLLILIVDAAQRNQYRLVALLFSILVLSKHLFVPLAPLFAIYLLCGYCQIQKLILTTINNNKKNNKLKNNKNYDSNKLKKSKLMNASSIDTNNDNNNTTNNISIFSFLFKFTHLLFIALFCLCLALLPFLIHTLHNREECLLILHQIFSRLFPFQRGLVHAYWAPNIWALYMFLDRILVILNKRFFFIPTSTLNTSSTSGLVANIIPSILPPIPPSLCILLILLFSLPSLLLIIKKTNSKILIYGIYFISLTSFLLGYHVHEKAILIPIVILSLIIFDTRKNLELLILLYNVGCVSLFPLFVTFPELFTKIIIYMSFQCGLWFGLLLLEVALDKSSGRLLVVQYSVLSVLFVFGEIIHPLLFRREDGSLSWPFLPLMLTSVICSLQICYCWWISLRVILSEINNGNKNKNFKEKNNLQQDKTLKKL